MSGLAAVVVGPADFHHLHARIDQVDHRFEACVVQRIGQQAFGWIIGGDQQQDAALEQCLEQPGDEHRIADVVHMELVETQHLAIAEQFIEGDRQGVGLIAVLEHALVQLGEKLMEVQALFSREGNGPEKPVEQPAFAAPHGTMQVKARKGFAPQCPSACRHAGPCSRSPAVGCD